MRKIITKIRTVIATLLTVISVAIILTPIVLFVIAPVQADAATIAFYRPHITTQTGLPIYSTFGWVAFSPMAFDTIQDGLFTLQPDGQFTTAYVGLVQVTGSCVQSKQSTVGIRLVIDGYSQPLMVAKTLDEVFTFSTAFHAGDVYIEALNYNSTYDVLKCDIVFERMG